MSTKKIPGTAENWENGKLGTDPKHAKALSKEACDQVDAALGLQAISIRLNVDLIDTFKRLAAYHGIGYQPLMRDALRRFAEAELKQILIANGTLPPAKQVEQPCEDEPPQARKAA